jgi:archaellum biogenesis ATPase FlaH
MIESIKKPSGEDGLVTATYNDNFNSVEPKSQGLQKVSTYEDSRRLADLIQTSIFPKPQNNLCGFDIYLKDGKVVKHPLSIQGDGVPYSDASVTDSLGGLDEVDQLHKSLQHSFKKRRVKYCGLVFHANISKTTNGFDLVCLDVDFKNATEPSKLAADLFQWAKKSGYLVELSHSEKGFHIFIAVEDASKLPKKFQLDVKGAEVEIFSHHVPKALMLTGNGVSGAFIDSPVNLVDQMARNGININAPQKALNPNVDEDGVIQNYSNIPLVQSKVSPFNQAALEQSDKWVLDMDAGAVKVGDSWRIPSKSLGRNLEEDISIHPTGIVDFGVADQGDPREGRRTPTELVAEQVFGDINKWQEAKQWLLERIEFDQIATKTAKSEMRIKNPLSKLLSMEITKEMIQELQDAKFAWRKLIVRGHLIIIVAEANGGKTTILTFICAELVKDGYQVIYINADASMSNLKEYAIQGQHDGYVVISPDLSNVTTDDVISLLKEMSKSDEDYSKTVIVLDTLKKFADLMQKSRAKEFNNILRALTTKGLTVICLAHTNKYKDADGRPVFEGTGDLRNDCDELIYLNPVTNPDGTKTVTTDYDKVRADIENVSFKILPNRSVVVLPTTVDTVALAKEQKTLVEDAELIEFISFHLQEFSKSKPELIKLAKDAGIEANRRVVERVVEQYCQGKAIYPKWRRVRNHPNGYKFLGLTNQNTGE